MPFLLVYDNVDTPETLRDLVPAVGARILITSRWADWMGRAVEMKLDLFGKEPAAEFLQKRAGRNDPAGAARLAAALGHLPLALDHAGAYCRLTGSSFDAYREKTDTRIARAPTGAAYPASVAATFGSRSSRSWRRTRRPRRCSDCFAFLAPERIPLDLIADTVADEDERAETLMALAGVSLLEHDHAGATPVISVHRLVQAAMRARLGERQGAHAERATLALRRVSRARLWQSRGLAAMRRAAPACACAGRLLSAGKHEVPEAGGGLFDLPPAICTRAALMAKPSRCFTRRSRSRSACMGAAIHGSRTRSATLPCCCTTPAAPRKRMCTTAK